MSKVIHVAVGAALALAAGIAGAEPGNYLDEMARLDAQIALQRKQIEARALATEAAGRLTLPTVRSISGFEDDLSAVLSYRGARKVTVKRGDRLPGGVDIVGVRQQGVLVSIGKKVALLDFTVPEDSNGAASSPGVAQLSGGLMPPLPVVNVPLPGSIGRAGGQGTAAGRVAAQAAPSPAAAEPAPTPAAPANPMPTPAAPAREAASLAPPAGASAAGATAASAADVKKPGKAALAIVQAN